MHSYRNKLDTLMRSGTSRSILRDGEGGPGDSSSRGKGARPGSRGPRTLRFSRGTSPVAADMQYDDDDDTHFSRHSPVVQAKLVSRDAPAHKLYRHTLNTCSGSQVRRLLTTRKTRPVWWWRLWWYGVVWQRTLRKDPSTRTNTFFSAGSNLRPFSSHSNSHVDVEQRKTVTYAPLACLSMFAGRVRLQLTRCHRLRLRAGLGCCCPSTFRMLRRRQ